MSDNALADVKRACKELLARIAALEVDKRERTGFWNRPAASAVRRQSMELTRALARMRKATL